MLLLGGTTVQADESAMDTEIDFLLDEVVNSNCVFTRNGNEYAAAAARDHLRMKRKRGRNKSPAEIK